MKQRYVWVVWVMISTALLFACGTANEPAVTAVPPTNLSPPTEGAAPLPREEPTQEVVEGTEVVSSLDPGFENLAVEHMEIEVVSAGKAYLSYLSAPAGEGVYPGVILIHSFNGLEEGYRTLTDQFAGAGYVVLAVGWQTYERSPDDTTVKNLLLDSLAYLKSRDDVDGERIGLTGFCAGGRYTMLFLPQIRDFTAGVAWYGFPYRGDTLPADLIEDLSSPLLIIHGTADSPSPIEDIYRYASALEDAGKAFDLKVYDDEPHGFMLTGGQLRADAVAQDAYEQMVGFFDLHLK